MRTRDKIKKYRKVIIIISKFLGLFGFKTNYYLFKLFTNFPTKIGVFLRYITIKNCSKKCGWNVCIKKGCIIKSPQNIVFGNNVSINELCFNFIF